MSWGRVEVTGGFLLLAAWLNYLDEQCLLPLTLVACLLHELGHFGMIYLMGRQVTRVRVTAVGAEMLVNRPMGYLQEGLTALAGPGVNLFLAVVFSCWEWGYFFSGINLVLGCFNLLPVGTLDGGRALRCTLTMLLEPECAEKAAAGLNGVLCALLLAFGGALLLRFSNPTLLLVAVWLMSCRKND